MFHVDFIEANIQNACFPEKYQFIDNRARVIESLSLQDESFGI